MLGNHTRYCTIVVCQMGPVSRLFVGCCVWLVVLAILDVSDRERSGAGLEPPGFDEGPQGCVVLTSHVLTEFDEGPEPAAGFDELSPSVRMAS